jgi:DNA-binding MarR family transcriptional regulator
MAIFKEGLEDEVIRLFYELHNLLEIILKYSTNKSLTLKESFILESTSRLSLTQDNMVSTLAELLQISSASVSIAVSNLDKKGFLKKVHSKVDRRIVYLVVTKKAELVLQKQKEFRERALSDIFGQLNMVEKASIASSLKKMRQFVKKDTERIRKDKASIANKD